MSNVFEVIAVVGDVSRRCWWQWERKDSRDAHDHLGGRGGVARKNEAAKYHGIACSKRWRCLDRRGGDMDVQSLPV